MINTDQLIDQLHMLGWILAGSVIGPLVLMGVADLLKYVRLDKWKRPDYSRRQY